MGVIEIDKGDQLVTEQDLPPLAMLAATSPWSRRG